MDVLSASSPSKLNLPDNGSLAGPMHRARAETQSRVGVQGGVVRSATAGAAREACAAYAGVPEGAVYLSGAGAAASMQAWWRKAGFKAVVLFRQPPNHAFEGSAQQGPLLGTLLASLVGAPSTQPFGVSWQLSQ